MPTAPSRSRRASATTAKATLPSKSATGATSAPATVADVICPAAPRRAGSAVASAHQTHGAVTPLTGGITSVAQLMNGGRSVAKGTAATFDTLGSYTAHLRGLDLHGLRTHAIGEKIVPIDDRERLIRRLENQWTTTSARQPGRGSSIPARLPFTQEQIDAQAAIRNQLLRH